MTFPVPLSPIEVSCLLEDSPSHAMHFFLRLHQNGRLQKPEFENAVQAAIARHPLFSAVVHQAAPTRWEWIAGPDEPLSVRWQSGDTDQFPECKPLDIFEQRGLNVTVIEGESDSAVILQFHHGVCDGLSASDFTADLLTCYAIELDPDTPMKFKRINAIDLLKRGDWDLSWKEKCRWNTASLFSLARFRKFYKRKPVFMLNRKRPAESDPMNPVPRAIFRRFTKQESVAINQQARAAETNVNGLLLATMFSAFSDWRSSKEETKDSDLFRVSIPISLRGAPHRTVPAANIVSLVCFDRTVAEIPDTQSLIESLNAEIETINREKRGLILPTAMQLMLRWPNKLAEGMRRKRFWGTTLISNLGPVLTTCHLPKQEGLITIGDLIVDRAEFLALLRPGHCASMAASVYGGKITLGMQFDERMISEAEAEELFQNYIERLQTD